MRMNYVVVTRVVKVHGRVGGGAQHGDVIDTAMTWKSNEIQSVTSSIASRSVRGVAVPEIVHGGLDMQQNAVKVRPVLSQTSESANYL